MAPRRMSESALGRTARRLPTSFYARDAVTVARELIGCLFTHKTRAGVTVVRLVETEAYRGAEDPGSHGYRGETPRTRTMFGPPGRLYVYFTYGMHWCVNIVTARTGVCEAVLLRAAEPVEGLPLMRARRGVDRDELLCAGPARLAQAMGLAKAHDGLSLLRGSTAWCAEDGGTHALRSHPIARTPRVGLAPGRGHEIEWRFVAQGNRFASRRR